MGRRRGDNLVKVIEELVRVNHLYATIALLQLEHRLQVQQVVTNKAWWNMTNLSILEDWLEKQENFQLLHWVAIVGLKLNVKCQLKRESSLKFLYNLSKCCYSWKKYFPQSASGQEWFGCTLDKGKIGQRHDLGGEPRKTMPQFWPNASALWREGQYKSPNPWRFEISKAWPSLMWWWCTWRGRWKIRKQGPK